MNIRPLLLSILLLIATTSGAQVFKAAVMGGMNISQVDGDEVYGYKRVGGNFGAAVILPLKNWDITLETVFNQKGAYEKPQQLPDSVFHRTFEYDLRLNYVEVPVMVHYTDKEFIGAGLGFSWGRLVSAKEVEHGGAWPPYSDTVKFNKNDFNILVDLQIRIYRQLKFNIRYAYSLASLRERTFYALNSEPWQRKQYNNLFTFRLVYVINEKYTPREKKPPLE